jgi:hypothetical protein
MYYNLIKTVLQLGASLGAGFIVGDVVKATTPATSGTIRNICKSLGAFALGGAAGGIAHDYMGKLLDSVFASKKKEEVKSEPAAEGGEKNG